MPVCHYALIKHEQERLGGLHGELVPNIYAL